MFDKKEPIARQNRDAFSDQTTEICQICDKL
jgi:hypothetical protein